MKKNKLVDWDIFKPNEWFAIVMKGSPTQVEFFMGKDLPFKETSYISISPLTGGDESSGTIFCNKDDVIEFRELDLHEKLHLSGSYPMLYHYKPFNFKKR